MKKQIKIVALLCALILLPSTKIIFAHPGRTDDNGGHYVRTEGHGYPVGSYHYHNGGETTSSSATTAYIEPKKEMNVEEVQSIDCGSEVEIPIIINNSTDLSYNVVSSNENIVISNGNVLKGIAVGSAVITVSSSDVDTVSFEVEVKESFPTEIKAISDVELQAGEREFITVNVLPEYVSNKNISWTSSDVEVVSVSEVGEIEGHSNGSAEITAVTDNGITTSFMVENIGGFPERITLSNIEKTLNIGETLELMHTIIPEEEYSNPLEWSSSNEDCIVVNQQGIVEAMKVGKAIISVEAFNGVSAEVELEVVEEKNVVIDIIAGVIAIIILLFIGIIIIGAPIFVIYKIRKRKK